MTVLSIWNCNSYTDKTYCTTCMTISYLIHSIHISFQGDQRDHTHHISTTAEMTELTTLHTVWEERVHPHQWHTWCCSSDYRLYSMVPQYCITSSNLLALYPHLTSNHYRFGHNLEANHQFVWTPHGHPRLSGFTRSSSLNSRPAVYSSEKAIWLVNQHTGLMSTTPKIEF